MLRIALIIAILAGIGSIAVRQVVVKDKITKLQTNLSTAKSQRDQANMRASEAKRAERKAESEAQRVTALLTDTSNRLDVVQSKEIQQQKRADDLSAKLNQTLKERNDAQDQLAAFKATGVPVGQIKNLHSDLVKAQQQQNVFAQENKVLLRDNKSLRTELDRYEGTLTKVQLPQGLTGKVIAVDPKYDFVVLNIGSKEGVLKYGEMLVNRGGKLIAKVRITRVEANRCIANIVPGWQMGDVMEGDQVVY